MHVKEVYVAAVTSQGNPHTYGLLLVSVLENPDPVIVRDRPPPKDEVVAGTV